MEGGSIYITMTSMEGVSDTTSMEGVCNTTNRRRKWVLVVFILVLCGIIVFVSWYQDSKKAQLPLNPLIHSRPIFHPTTPRGLKTGP